MSKTFMKVGVGFTVWAFERLPDGIHADDVSEEIRRVIQARLSEWYDARGHELLALEPEVF